MDNNQPAQSPPSLLRWGAFFIIVLILGTAGFIAARNNSNSNKSQDPQTQGPNPSGTISSPLAQNTVVFGSWTGSNSEISAVDLTSLKSSLLASLPVNIKKVSVLTPNTLLYIAETDKIKDHGKQLKIYDIKNKKATASIAADNDFGIDDYVLSPNKKFVAIWEVAFAPGSQTFSGGRSRVYAVNLSNPSAKRLLYDEEATAPVHYPRAILDDGRVFADKFMPNDPSGGTGWAYGMSVVNFDGSGKQDLSQMENGSYGTQPSLSPDGRLLVFAGYDGSQGLGTADNSGYRQAVLTPNTVETLNTATLERKRLANLASANIYTAAGWDKSTNNIILTVISRNKDQTGLFSYNLSTNSPAPLRLPTNGLNLYSFVSQLSGGKLLIATTENSPSSVGNLGEGYANLINQLYVLDTTSNQASSLQFNNSLVQHIGTLPQNYFQNVLGVAHAQGGNPADPNIKVIDLYSNLPSQENLQLKTFLLKPELAPIREKQQTDAPKQEGLPRCRDLITQQCLAAGSQDPRCAQLFSGNKDAVCYDSPLYLYGTPGETVSVKVQTPVYNDQPNYSDGYHVTLRENGNMQVGGQLYSALNYDYESNLRMLKPPTKGAVVARVGVEKTLREYAKKLGLNEKETADLVKVGKERVTTPYAFISFYDHETSSSILPLTFSKKPDNYLNVVFYFKLLKTKPNYTPVPPTFGKPLERSGFTAVEVSEIVE